jgi:mRNA degradation ribonuclease J1/J2
MKETEKVLEEMKKSVISKVERFVERNKGKISLEDLEVEIRTSALRQITEKIERRPVISVFINQY